MKGNQEQCLCFYSKKEAYLGTASFFLKGIAMNIRRKLRSTESKVALLVWILTGLVVLTASVVFYKITGIFKNFFEVFYND